MTPADLQSVLDLPRGAQPRALRELRARLGPAPGPERWNSRFGPGSLFEAWTQTTVARGVYTANAKVVRNAIEGRPAWRIVEVGGGDGSLWSTALGAGDKGEIVVVDPCDEVHDRVRARVTPGVHVAHIRASVEAASLPESDLAVCSLTLHHVAGADAAERAGVGLVGPGKREVLERMGEAVRARRGLVLLNEADVYCDVGLAPGDPILVDRLIDSYVRRCGRAIVHDVMACTDDRLRERWLAVIRQWCVDQVAVADLPLAERDVYELDVPRWLTVISAAGLDVVERRFTDDWGLFHQYMIRPRD